MSELTHRLRPMRGRDPLEPHRTATPLELFYDLVFVVAFSQAGTQAANLLAAGSTGPALMGFTFALFAICWAWITYAWLASAYDNDDVFFRIATMVQMIGVIMLALGLPETYASIDAGADLENRVVIAGYVVMRVAVVALWLRAARHDPARRRTALTYASLVSIVQVGWVALLVASPSLEGAFAGWAILVACELAVPVIAERRDGGTPWHPHHIAERYGLLVIITLGEVVVGTVLAISAVVEEQGWDLEAVLTAFGGTLLAFGMWWVYFLMPFAPLLARRRGWAAFAWGYGHIPVFGAVAATGAGLHVAALVVEETATVDDVVAVVAVAVPVAVFVIVLFVLETLLLRRVDAFRAAMFAASLVPLAVAAWIVTLGATMGTGIVVAALSPVVLIVGYETAGHRHQAAALERALA
ncbi:low temperature requirement protein A [Agromyces aurantiacus]|uniref:Low temperature requirement protein A n=1 Tax=Agromyces aurantiacus TaxID=165814 RepID=A0ABV9R690_9MICO|nr:low temperature requirement protein A [Agromyces aurantiacus]MBM7504330.1 low temperature requirement protein LtrA [Agromyces aurantiacus]